MKTKIVKCTCRHDFQDREYGRGNRVANTTSKKAGEKPYVRCTVCGKEH